MVVVTLFYVSFLKAISIAIVFIDPPFIDYLTI